MSTAEAHIANRVLVDVACPGCGGVRREAVFDSVDPLSLETFSIVRCGDCDLAYVHPRPSDRDLARYYPTDSYYAERHPFLKDEFMGLRVRALSAPKGNRKLLDFGCGRGDFVIASQKRGWQAMGAEMADAPLMRTHEQRGIEVVPIESVADFADESFDAITLWHVFEHLAAPRSTLRTLRRILQKEGRLLIEVPNFGGWLASLAGRTWYHIEVPRHLVHYDRRTLTRMLAAEGFIVERTHTFSLEYDAFGLLQGWLNRICRTPNHLYQLLIGQPTSRARRDTLLSFGLLLPLGFAAAVVAVLAPLAGQGGVLRVIARKSDGAS